MEKEYGADGFRMDSESKEHYLQQVRRWKDTCPAPRDSRDLETVSLDFEMGGWTYRCASNLTVEDLATSIVTRLAEKDERTLSDAQEAHKFFVEVLEFSPERVDPRLKAMVAWSPLPDRLHREDWIDLKRVDREKFDDGLYNAVYYYPSPFWERY